MPPVVREKRVVEIVVDARQFKAATKDVNRNLREMRKQAQRTADTLRTMFTAFVSFEGARLTKDLIMATAEVERLDTVIRGTVGNQTAFAESMDFLRDLSDDLGVSMRSLQQGFAAFAGAGLATGKSLDQIEESFRGLVVSAAAFMTPGAELQLMLQGAQQLAGGAVVNMEDLNQVMQRVPNAMDAALFATREMTGNLEMTGQEMRNLISTGKVATDEWLPLFTKRLEQINLEGAAAASNTFAASLNRLDNAFRELLRTMVPLLDKLATLVEFMTEATEQANAFWSTVAGGGTAEAAIARMNGVTESVGNTLELNIKLVKAREEVLAAEKRLAEFNARSPRGSEGIIGSLLLGAQGITPEQRRAQYQAGVDAARARMQEIRDEIETESAFAANDREFAREMRGFVPTGPTEAQLLKEQRDFAGGPFTAADSARTGMAGGGGGAAVKAVEDYTDALQSLQEQLDPTIGLWREYAETTVLLDNALQQGIITQQQYTEVERQAGEQLQKNLEELKDTAGDLPQLALDIGDAFGDAFAGMITGATSFEDALASLESQLIATITQALILEPLKRGLGAAFKGGDILGAAFGGGIAGLLTRQGGGPVEAGRPYLVGERGPEIVIPRQSGRVMPNEHLGGQTVVINFNAPVQGEGLRQSAQQIAAQVGAQTNRAVRRNG